MYFTAPQLLSHTHTPAKRKIMENENLKINEYIYTYRDREKGEERKKVTDLYANSN